MPSMVAVMRARVSRVLFRSRAYKRALIDGKTNQLSQDGQIILAHIGRAYYLRNIVGHLERIRTLENVYCDTAMVNHWEVLEYLFQNFDLGRILYATDLPIAVCGGKSIENTLIR